eukprot:TRINITY_DN17389_c0_g1_i2.p1 TRINITY_DN17389_c0_g1~~TRINITY_DN17389_c0_g1_i2.p1  ORF type:complete len:937 (+),score=159.02 TRINITY_DN17389_c0_g1_i2:84-2894(+)
MVIRQTAMLVTRNASMDVSTLATAATKSHTSSLAGTHLGGPRSFRVLRTSWMGIFFGNRVPGGIIVMRLTMLLVSLVALPTTEAAYVPSRHTQAQRGLVLFPVHARNDSGGAAGRDQLQNVLQSTKAILGGKTVALQEGWEVGMDDNHSPTDLPNIFETIQDSWNRRVVSSNHTSVIAMMGLHNNGRHDLEEVTFSLYFNTFLSMLTVATFSLFRIWHPIVYAHRAVDVTDSGASTRNVDEAPGGLFGWAYNVWALTDTEALEKSGLDGLMLFSFYRLSRRIMSVVGLVAVTVLVPTHYFLGKDDPSLDMLSRTSIETLTTDPHEVSSAFWIHAGMVWFVVLAVLQLVYTEHHRYLELRFAWLCRLQPPQATTLLIENIPRSLCSDTALRDYFVKLFGAEAIERAYIVRRTGRLTSLIARRNDVADQLKEYEAAWEAVGKDPERRPTLSGPFWCCWMGGGEDAIEEHTNQLNACQARVDHERRCVEESVPLKETGLGGVCSRAGFVTFTSRRACRLASREQYKPDAMVMAPVYPPAPEDVSYENIAKDPLIQHSQAWLYGFSVLGIFLVWLPLVASVGALVSFHGIEEQIPIVKSLFVNRPTLSLMMETILAGALLRLLMSWMPTALMIVINRFLTPQSGNKAQIRLQGVYYLFLVIFVLMVTSITSSLLDTIRVVVDSPRGLLPLLASSLPTKSHWYTEYIILGWATDCFELLRLPNLLIYLSWRLLLGKEEAKRRAEPQDQDFHGMGARMARVALHLTILLVFCTCFPPIALVGWASFSVGTATRVYLSVFAENRMPDYGGEFWVEGLKHIMVALIIFVLLMVSILHEHASWRHTSVAFASLLAIAFGWSSLSNLVWQCLPFETIAEVDDEPLSCNVASSSNRIYIQPECVPEGGSASVASAPSSHAIATIEEARLRDHRLPLAEPLEETQVKN